MSIRFSLNGFNGSPWTGAQEDLAGWIAASAAAGFDCYSPDGASLAAWRARGNRTADAARVMREHGLGCEIVAGCAMLDGSKAPLRGLREAADDASLLGARYLQVNVNVPGAAARLDAVGAACEAISGSGLVLALEYMPFTGLATLDETLKIARAVGSERAGALVDIWHHTHDPNGWETLRTAPLDLVAYVEFDDALPFPSEDIVEETMQRRTFPGEGRLECDRFAKLLLERGYDGLVSLEILNREWRSRSLAGFALCCIESTKPFWSAHS